ncbi:MAG: peptide chain release factor N(5)-glutamine methyltransferase, partial [Acidimicrobiales bacterium]
MNTEQTDETDDADETDATAGTVPWRDLLAEATQRLTTAESPDPEVSARRIVEEASGFEGADLFPNLDELVTVRGMARFDAMIARRLDGEPLQYVLGRWAFRTLDLAVDRRVLIPRPETEEVTGWALEEFDRVTDLAAAGGAPEVRVVDLGTGSGAIGLSFLAERRNAQVWLTDRSADALAVARANLAGLGRHGSRGRLVEGSWFEALPAELAGGLDLVVSNPPYVAPDDELPAEVRDWEPSSALVAADAGLADLRVLVAEAPRWLTAEGALVVELAPVQAEQVADEA